MAFITGYVTLPIDSYDVWKNAVNGNGYNVDLSYGCQCWDLASEFWWNAGFPTGYPTLAGTGSAYGAWADRAANAGVLFDLIYDKTQLKRGDVIVFNYYTGNPYGHIGFADEDYNGTDTINILSQNNGGNPDPQGGTDTNINTYSLTHFLGAFRFKAWNQPTPVARRQKFPWFIMTRKLNDKRIGL